MSKLQNQMRKISYFVLLIAGMIFTGCQKEDLVVRMAVTTDVHGMIYPKDLIRRENSDHSLSHIYNYAREQRDKQDTLFFLLDNGDFLQGQPSVYYSNFIDTTGRHLSARVMNFMGYSAGTVGNHDIEAGPRVYDKVRREMEFPWLAANAVNTSSGEPYFEPYTVLKAGNKKIAILGLITPGIPHWLPKNLWPEMEFRDMVETAAAWIPRIRQEENPDLMVGLFHSGTDASYGGSSEEYMNDNAVLLVAENVPGFDVIFAGHDHQVSVQWVVNKDQDSVLIVDPGSHARFAGEVTVAFSADGNVRLEGRNIPMKEYNSSADFNKFFADDYEKITAYLNDTITWLQEEMVGSDALFGPSPMMSLIHQVQLELSGADLSFTAPLSLSARLRKGPLLVSDMFQLYRFENMLYTMELSGQEIDSYLEYAAGLWFDQMNGPDDHMLLYREGDPGWLANRYYNFSSAAGITYDVDVTRPEGNRVTIHAFADGTPFSVSEEYLVAINSYRGNGGGGHLTRGAGIPAADLESRILWSTDIDLRYYLMQSLSQSDTWEAGTLDNWRLLPENWTRSAALREREYFQ
jgi:2',3'-cyclic-nucleotide 2'-phosphodiesterase/3'-nucleotidase